MCNRKYLFALITATCVFLLFASALFSAVQANIMKIRGQVTFTSDAPLELIKATSESLTGSIDPSTGQFAFLLNIRSFSGFNSRLQQEHFNEKYMESERFPTASFSGKIIDPIDFNANGEYEVRAKGKLEIHGQTQVRIIKCKIKVLNGNLTINSLFRVPLSDHNITIPRIISEKIATEIDVKLVAGTHP